MKEVSLRSTFRGFSLWASTLLLLSFTLTSASSVFAADPDVVIAVDNTASSSCTEQITKNMGTADSTTSTSICSTGTVIDSKKVHLSEAVAAREKYVIVPPQSATLEALKKFSDEVRKLMKDKGDAIKASLPKPSKAGQSKSNVVHPNIACGSTAQISTTWQPSWTPITTLTSTIEYTLRSDCVTIILASATLYGDHAAYWDKMKYASGTWDPGCASAGSTTATYSIYEYYGAGFNFQPFVASSWPCFAATKSYINQGPLN